MIIMIIYNCLSPVRFQVIIKKNPCRPKQSHQIDYCNLLCNLVWGSAAVLGTHCNIWKRTYVLFVYLIMYTWLDKYVYMYT